MTKDYN